MEAFEVKILLKNLFARIVAEQSGGYALEGKLTDDEHEALRTAVELLGNGAPPAPVDVQPVSPPKPSPLPVYAPDPIPEPADEKPHTPAVATQRDDIDTSSLELENPPENTRLCLDFGTAMSKATLVSNGETEYDEEEITVLRLGEYGDDKEDFKLMSAVYIDDDGKLWFGQDALDYSASDAPDGSRQVMDNIKHWLSLGQVDAKVDSKFNPTDIPVTYAEVILAYLTFMTWTVNKALENLEQPPGGYPRNLNRRFAMPCLAGADFKEVDHRLSKYLGEAQILADTFMKVMRDGLSLERFMKAVKLLREGGPRKYKFVLGGLTEPLGVASSLMNYNSKNEQNMVAMVIDVGAGTTDFSLYRMRVDPENEIHAALEAAGSVTGITEAGNHLDSALMGLILSNYEIETGETIPDRVLWYLHRNIRDFKEDIFVQGEIHVSPPDEREVHITLQEFLDSPGVNDFRDAIDNKMRDILEVVGEDWTDLIGTPKIPYLTVVLTGGGASLPMMQELADREITVRGREIRVVSTETFPKWLNKNHSELKSDYPRIAVSLGGARKKLIKQTGRAKAVAGGVTGKPVYDDPKYQW